MQCVAVCCSVMQSRSARRAHPSCKTVLQRELQCVLQCVLHCMRQCQYLQCVLEHILWHLLDTLPKKIKIEGCSKEPGAPNSVAYTHSSTHHIFCEEHILLYLRDLLQKRIEGCSKVRRAAISDAVFHKRFVLFAVRRLQKLWACM